MSRRECHACRAPMRFFRHYRTDKSNPLEPDPLGRWRVVGNVYMPAEDDTPLEARWTSHFATCPARERFRKGKGTAAPSTTTAGGSA